jgi:hypothetical protein
MDLIQVQHHARDQRIGAVLARTHAQQAVTIHRNTSGLAGAGGAGKVQQDSVRIDGSLRRNRSNR